MPLQDEARRKAARVCWQRFLLQKYVLLFRNENGSLITKMTNMKVFFNILFYIILQKRKIDKKSSKHPFAPVVNKKVYDRYLGGLISLIA